MRYPIFEVPLLGGGGLIALVALLHLLIANLVVGGTWWLVYLEYRGLRGRSAAHDTLARHYARLVLILMGVVGSITGVGIWFSIMTVTPVTTVFLLRLLFWPILLEYVFFVVEIATLFPYYYLWDRLRARPTVHRGLITGTAIAALCSLFVINVMLSFMLTTGGWPATNNIWQAIFNPSMFPSALHRVFASLAVAGIFALIYSTTLPQGELRKAATRFAAWWIIIPTAINFIVGPWYLFSIQPAARYWLLGGSITLSLLWNGAIALGLFLIVFSYLQGVREPAELGKWAAVITLFAIFGTIALMEGAREGIRRPFLVWNVLYSNQVLVNPTPGSPGASWALARVGVPSVAAVNRTGILRAANFPPLPRGAHGPVATGEAIFKLECMSCHTVRGSNGILYATRGMIRPADAEYFLEHIAERHPYMPVFMGTPADEHALAAYLNDLQRRYPYQGPPLPRGGQPSAPEG